jgi:hypothetical protein
MEAQRPETVGPSARPRTPDSLAFRRITGVSSRDLLALMQTIAGENGSHKAGILDERLWRWQYVDLPSKEGRVYGAFDGARLVGYYHAPIYPMRVGGRSVRAAVPQDVAVSATMRGAGLFRRLATFATEDLARGGVDLAYTFPNKNSIHTFLKYNGYEKLATLDPWILPVDAGAIAASRCPVPGVGALARLVCNPALSLLAWRGAKRSSMKVVSAPAAAEVFASFGAQAGAHVERTPDHLAWRFGARPNAEFAFVGLRGGGREGDDLGAVVACKRDVVLGVETLLVMDVAHRPGQEEALVALLAGLARHGRELLGWRYGLMFAAGIGPAFDALPRAGFTRVPPRFTPRPLNLLVRAFGESPVRLPTDPRGWHLSLADWDVF